ncbi:MAG: hypothetical protein WD490_08020 [Opitutales bacterium]
MKKIHLSLLCILMTCLLPGEEHPIRIGVLQSTPQHAETYRKAGLDLAVLEMIWSEFEPEPGRVSQAYVDQQRERLHAFRDAGLDVILVFGVQYPPEWLRNLPHARYQNQYGESFIDPSPGMNVVNSVFNAEIREHQADYYAKVFEHLGNDFFGVRIGGGWYGEVNYPPHRFGEAENVYWGFDPIAQGKRPGLPEGMKPSPVPGWIPGSPEGDADAPRLFITWMLESLQHYHDWQIQTVREHYDGPLMMLYPSWGLRSGQLEAAIDGRLSGKTQAERNGEIQRGFDFERYVAGIRDPKVMPHSTWVDSDPAFGNDDSDQPADFSPLLYLHHLTRKHPLPLRVSGENTGGGGAEIMRLCGERVRRTDAGIFLWAFESDLMRGDSPGPRGLAEYFLTHSQEKQE